MSSGTVTTTTLPLACAAGATLASASCRLAKLLETVQGTAEGPVAVKLLSPTPLGTPS